MVAQHQQWPVSVLCEVLEVSRSGFYTSVHRHATTRREAAEDALVAWGKAIAAQTRQRYGSRRMAQHLQADGYAVGRYKARRLMQQAAGTVQRRPKRQPGTTDSRQRFGGAPNLLARQCDVAQPHHVWAGDITDVWTAEGWLYVAVLLDLYARKVVGWATRPHVDAALVQEALCMALGRRQPARGLLHHADRGSQYAGHVYQPLLAAHGIRGSMREKGAGLDNAVAERFFGSRKGERTALRHYATRQEAREDVVEDIEMFYNSTRLHSYLGYVSPNDYEELAKVA